MTKNKNLGIGEIKYGEVYLYYPIKLINNENIDNVKQSIIRNKLIICDDYFERMNEHLYQLEKKSIKYILEYHNFSEVQFETTEIIDTANDLDFKCFPEYQACVTQGQNNNLILTIDSLEEEKIYDYIFNMNRSIKNIKKVYGNTYADSYDYFFIRPARIYTSKNEKRWLDTCLYLYANGTIIIKVNFPLIDCDISGMMENDLDNYFEKIVTYNEKEFDTCRDYIRYLIREILGEYKLILDNDFYYINLLDFDGVPYDIKKINDQLIKDLYLITCAPVPEISRDNCLTEAKKHFKENSFQLTDSIYVFKTMGGCLHIQSKKATDFYLKKITEEAMDKKDALHIISNDLCTFTEFSINVLLLKRITVSATIYNLTNSTSLYKEKKEYNENQLFINRIQDNCYGSVSVQLKHFEKMLNLYTQKELLNDRFEIMRESRNLDELRKKDKDSSFYSIITFLFTLLFGLPTIKDTLLIVKNGFFNYNLIPYLSLEQISVVIWCLLIVFCAIRIHIISCIKNLFIK